MKGEVVVYTTQETLDHKGDPDSRYWWFFRRAPKAEEIRRIHFAVGGKVVASAPCYRDYDWPSCTVNADGELEYNSGVTAAVCWLGENVRPVENGPECKPFRGFRYRWWPEGVERG